VPTGTGNIGITAPKNQAVLRSAIISIKGAADGDVAKVVVNNYTLSQFKAGDKLWLYRMSDMLGNRKLGQQTITVRGYDQAGKLLDSETITVNILPAESGIATNNTDDNGRYWPSIRPGTLPPVPQTDNEPTI